MEKSINNRVRLLAFYLPQFHPIPENDIWWGEGFTEWTNVAKAKPLFPGHYQPHIPVGLGYYDLRNPVILRLQADLAKEHGIFGFCYYHYWFSGKRLLETPINQVLSTHEPDFPFCLCWANESWTKSWDGGNQEILIKQEYSEEDAHQHIRFLLEIFRDKRYIRVNNQPLFIIYRASKIPEFTIPIWREEAKNAGEKNVYLCKVESFPDEHFDPVKSGFDAAVEFQPDWKFFPLPQKALLRFTKLAKLQYQEVYDYSKFIQRMLKKDAPKYKRYPCVTPSWDNYARRKTQTIILHNSTPAQYLQWLTAVLKKFKPYSQDENFIFINAWNEWGEGAHLEPCQKWGTGYLDATRAALLTQTNLIYE